MASILNSVEEKTLRKERSMAGRTALPRCVSCEKTIAYEVLNRLPHGIIVFDSAGQITFANDRYSRMYGFADGEVQIGMSLLELFTLRRNSDVPTLREVAYIRQLKKAVQRGKEVSGTLQTDEGRTIHFINTPLPTGGWFGTHEDVTEKRQAERHIEHLANHDPLTDLLNRAALLTHLDDALQEIAPSKLIAVLFLDLDNFKVTNDTLGHPIGDELLKGVAARILRCTRRTEDFVARFGGDEFVIVSSALSKPSQAAELAERIRRSLTKPFSLQGHKVEVDVSIGIALAPRDGQNGEELLKNADLALYSAKRNGRGAHAFFERAMDDHMTARRELEKELRAALAKGEFEVHYQPLLSLSTNRITCCEALIRWNHPTRGLVPPGEFIPMAEEIGLIDAIGDWVIRAACNEAVRWPADVMLAVNVSPLQFRGQGLSTSVSAALKAANMSPQRLELEITEAVLLEDSDQTLDILKGLQELGVSIAMDDFGTGYSSLSYLQRFPFDRIKIDQSFVRSLSGRGEAKAIIRAVTSLADSLKMETTAEGVETESQKALMTELGCSQIQGHLFSKPVPASKILSLLHHHRQGHT